MPDSQNKTTLGIPSSDRAVLARVSKWTDAAEVEMHQEGMSDAEQKRHWKMLALVAERTVEEFDHVG